jgi:4'-phosphopantetheinyl transferase
MTLRPQVWSRAGLPQRLDAKQVHVWAWRLDPGHGSGFGVEQASWLDGVERDRLRRFHFDRDRVRFAIAHATTRRILGSYLNRRPQDLALGANAFGKPALAREEHRSSLHFNLSHSRSLAMLALSAETEVGIDVEDIRPMEPEVAEDHFSASELKALSSLQEDAWLKAFYLCWTRKEAIVKAEGVGLSLALDCFDVSVNPDLPPALLGVRPPAVFRYPWTLHDLSVASEQVCGTLAAGDPRAEVSCFWVGEGAPACV